jgi:hypothetical protein
MDAGASEKWVEWLRIHRNVRIPFQNPHMWCLLMEGRDLAEPPPQIHLSVPTHTQPLNSPMMGADLPPVGFTPYNLSKKKALTGVRALFKN